jgi:hypothetical protein
VKPGLPSVIQRLIKWRDRNGLSQRGAVEVMRGAGFPIKLSQIQHWECADRAPNEAATKLLEIFLEQHPRIENPPRFGRWIDRKKE